MWNIVSFRNEGVEQGTEERGKKEVILTDVFE
jgi:hypothetical protein